jgi:hypothetical protein
MLRGAWRNAHPPQNARMSTPLENGMGGAWRT